MSDSKTLIPRAVKIRFEDENEEHGFIDLSGLLVESATAVSIVNGYIEVLRVAPTADSGVVNFNTVIAPFFYAGAEPEAVYHDMMNLCFAEFVGKYPICEDE